MARPISIQLYTLREQMPMDVAGGLERLARIGYAAVEPAGLYGLSARAFRGLLDASGLSAPSAHAHGRLGDELYDELAEVGCNTVVVASLPRDRFEDADGVKRAADVLNNAVDAAQRRGMRLGYHNHHFEFLNAVDGGTAYDAFVAQLRPEVVVEVDVYWAQTGGVDPVSLVRDLGARCTLLHVKDGPCTVSDPMLAVGDGVVDVPAVLAANDAVEVHVVELDRYDGDMWVPVERSRRYLAGLE